MTKISKISRLLIAALISVSAINMTPVYGNTDPHLLINHLPATGDAKPILKDGATLVPIRVISETLGSIVHWDQRTKKISISHAETVIEMTLDNPQVKVDGAFQTITTPPMIHNGSTMLPIRFVGEALDAQVHWDNTKKTASVISSDIPEAQIPDFTSDAWGREVKTKNLANNAVIFPYTLETVPNWVYENINMTDIALASKSGVKQIPKDFFSSDYDFDQAVKVLDKHFDTVLNIDYKTIDRAQFKNYIDETFSDKSFKAKGFSNIEWASAYVDYVKDNKIATEGSAVVLPEMFWANNAGEVIVSAWVTLKVTNQEIANPRLVFKDFGNFPYNPPSGRFPTTKTGHQYEGLVQFKMIDYKVDYSTNAIIDQIHPEAKGFGGAYTRQ